MEIEKIDTAEYVRYLEKAQYLLSHGYVRGSRKEIAQKLFEADQKEKQ